ncbi:HAD hydrolase-like protein [Brevibacterium luteolum]|nr:HAD hydrolase-like protein [Brevibacterium luteolum]
MTAQVVGKPNSAFLHLAGATVDPSRSSDATWVIGNDRTTDIPMGRAAGARTVQVRTGTFALQDDEPHAGADHTADSVAELPALIRGVLA